MTQATLYMNQALCLAAQGRYTVSPNPMVGCVIVKNNQLIGQGYHQYPGLAHAEIIALQAAGADAKDATVYLNLEPCAHYGRTPPCVLALIAARVAKVYIACLDPNPLVCGKGVAALQAAGISVELGLCKAAAEELNEIFIHYMIHQRPFVISKWAMSLDGKTITHAEDTRYISGSESQIHTHELRCSVDAIMVGANTIRCDDPLLTARLNNESAKQPLRIVLSRSGRLPERAKIFDQTLPGRTLVVTMADVSFGDHVEVLRLVAGCTLGEMLAELGKRGITSVLVEGGMGLHQQFMQDDLINKLHVYVSPVVIGAMERKKVVSGSVMRVLGSDIHIAAACC